MDLYPTLCWARPCYSLFIITLAIVKSDFRCKVVQLVIRKCIENDDQRALTMFLKAAKQYMTDTNGEIVLDNFSYVLRRALSQRYQRASSAHLCAEFNLRSLGAPTISSETMRKWRSGISMPAPGHMIILRDWLSLDLNDIFSRKILSRVGDVPAPPDVKKSVTPDVALDALDESIKVLIDTRKVISDEIRKIEGEKKR